MSDLRDQIAEALYQWTLAQAAPGGTRPPYLDPRTETNLRENSAARADAVMRVVEPALLAEQVTATDRADTLAARLQQAEKRLAELENALTWHTSCTNCATLLDSGYAETMRAEQAEAANERARALATSWRGTPHNRAANDILAALEPPKETR